MDISGFGRLYPDPGKETIPDGPAGTRSPRLKPQCLDGVGKGCEDAIDLTGGHVQTQDVKYGPSHAFRVEIILLREISAQMIQEILRMAILGLRTVRLQFS